MRQRILGTGSEAVAVSAVGLGAMPLSLKEGLERSAAVRVVHAALDAGVTLIDTADAYAPLDGNDVGHNERLVAHALREWPGDTSEVLVATKGGHTREPGGAWGTNGSPEHLRSACEASLRALGVPAIDLYQLHRPDPEVPFADSVGALKDLRDDGLVVRVGLSNVDVAQIDQALAILGSDGLASVQNRFSPAHREHRAALRHCDQLGIAFLPWSPLGGMWGDAGRIGEQHAAFADVALMRGVSPQQVTIAWHLALADNVIPIPGASRPESIRSSADAAGIELTTAELDLLGWD